MKLINNFNDFTGFSRLCLMCLISAHAVCIDNLMVIATSYTFDCAVSVYAKHQSLVKRYSNKIFFFNLSENNSCNMHNFMSYINT
jgi:hypothetical protein